MQKIILMYVITHLRQIQTNIHIDRAPYVKKSVPNYLTPIDFKTYLNIAEMFKPKKTGSNRCSVRNYEEHQCAWRIAQMGGPDSKCRGLSMRGRDAEQSFNFPALNI
jgi:hypothetical protein